MHSCLSAGVIPDETKALSLLAPANAVAGLLPGGGLLPTPNPLSQVSLHIMLHAIYAALGLYAGFFREGQVRGSDVNPSTPPLLGSRMAVWGEEGGLCWLLSPCTWHTSSLLSPSCIGGWGDPGLASWSLGCGLAGEQDGRVGRGLATLFLQLHHPPLPPPSCSLASPRSHDQLTSVDFPPDKQLIWEGV